MEPLDFKKIKAELRSKFGNTSQMQMLPPGLCIPRSVSRVVADHVDSTFLQVFEEYQGFLEKFGDLRCCTRSIFLGSRLANVRFSSVSFQPATSWGDQILAKKCISLSRKGRPLSSV